MCMHGDSYIDTSKRKWHIYHNHDMEGYCHNNQYDYTSVLYVYSYALAI